MDKFTSVEERGTGLRGWTSVEECGRVCASMDEYKRVWTSVDEFTSVYKSGQMCTLMGAGYFELDMNFASNFIFHVFWMRGILKKTAAIANLQMTTGKREIYFFYFLVDISLQEADII